MRVRSWLGVRVSIWVTGGHGLVLGCLVFRLISSPAATARHTAQNAELAQKPGNAQGAGPAAPSRQARGARARVPRLGPFTGSESSCRGLSHLSRSVEAACTPSRGCQGEPDAASAKLCRCSAKDRRVACCGTAAWPAELSPCAQVGLSAFAFLFSEFIQYSQARVNTADQLQQK